VTTKPGLTGESTKQAVKTIAQGMPAAPAEPVVLPRAFLLHADHGCSPHPAFPAPSAFDEGDLTGKTRSLRAARTRDHVGNPVAARPSRRAQARSSGRGQSMRHKGQTLMVRRRASAVSNHAAPLSPVVLANAGTHNHRSQLLKHAGPLPRPTTQPCGYGSSRARGRRRLRGDDARQTTNTQSLTSPSPPSESSAPSRSNTCPAAGVARCPSCGRRCRSGCEAGSSRCP
jgi:hypothetical protein